RRDYRDDFDSLEVYNGADAAKRSRVEAVLADWLHLLELGHKYVATGDSDSHRIQYQWAGYPRTYISMPLDKSGDEGPIDRTALIAALKAGRAFVTSGPMIDATIDGVGPGGTATLAGNVAHLHVRVRAAPWIDVSEVEVLLGASTLTRVPVAPSARAPAERARDLVDARKAAIRLERDFEVPFEGHEAKFVVVVVRGNRALDDTLPYMPIQPMAFTNPIWLARP
ncbi:MAG TPA: CehA/McbA family metallohydrolase, partial [Polyangiaceae bacterium]|nr:CehA/McbA family metallohydrolase [Polyangiaceae bacterium]